MRKAALLNDFGVTAALTKLVAPHIEAVRRMVKERDRRVGGYKFKAEGVLGDLPNTGIPMDGSPEHEAVLAIGYEVEFGSRGPEYWAAPAYHPGRRAIMLPFSVDVPWMIVTGNTEFEERFMRDLDRFDVSIRHEVTHAIRDAYAHHIERYTERMNADKTMKMVKQYQERGHRDLDFEVDAIVNEFDTLRRKLGQKRYDGLNEAGFEKLLPGLQFPRPGDPAWRKWVSRMDREGLLTDEIMFERRAGVGLEPGGTSCRTRNEDMPGTCEQTPVVPLGWEEWPEARRTAMNRMDRLAERVAKEVGEISSERVNEMGFDDISLAAAGFLLNNPNPSDEAYHKWADEQGFEHPVAEAAAYRLATAFCSFLLWGRANKEEVVRGDVDEAELSMGISVEMEHTRSRDVAERIALDHLAEIPDYYTRLAKMEKDAGIEA